MLEYFLYLAIFELVAGASQTALAYLLVLKADMGAIGSLWTLNILLVLRVLFHGCIFKFQVNWKEVIEGKNGLANRVKSGSDETGKEDTETELQ